MDEVAGTPVRLLLRAKGTHRIHRAQRVGNDRAAKRGRAPAAFRSEREDYPLGFVTFHLAPSHRRCCRPAYENSTEMLSR